MKKNEKEWKRILQFYIWLYVVRVCMCIVQRLLDKRHNSVLLISDFDLLYLVHPTPDWVGICFCFFVCVCGCECKVAKLSECERGEWVEDIHDVCVVFLVVVVVRCLTLFPSPKNEINGNSFSKKNYIKVEHKSIFLRCFLLFFKEKHACQMQ